MRCGGSTRLLGRPRVEHHGPIDFVLDFDQRAGIGRLVERLGDHQRDWLACIVNLVVLKRQVGLSLRAQMAPRTAGSCAACCGG